MKKPIPDAGFSYGASYRASDYFEYNCNWARNAKSKLGASILVQYLENIENTISYENVPYIYNILYIIKKNKVTLFFD